MFNQKLCYMKNEDKGEKQEQQEEVETTKGKEVEETQGSSEIEQDAQEETVEAEEKEETGEAEEKTEKETEEKEKDSTEDSEKEEKTEEVEEKKIDVSAEALVTRAKQLNPEATNETSLQTLVGRLDELEDYHSKSKEANSKLIEAFNSNPTVAEILRDVIEGADLRVAIARHFSTDDLVPQEGDPDFKAWQEAAEKRKKDIEGREKQAEVLVENTKKSTETVKVFADKHKFTQEETTEFLGIIDKAMDDLYSGKVTEDFLEKMLNAFNYKKDVKEAAQLGEIKGKNTKIEAKKKDGEKAGDGVPKLKTKAAIEVEKPKILRTLDEIVDKEQKKDIWKR